MDILPEAEVKEDQIREMDKDLTTTADINPDIEVWLSKIHALTEARHENHKKLTEINLLREECHAKCRILIVSIIICPTSRISMLNSYLS